MCANAMGVGAMGGGDVMEEGDGTEGGDEMEEGGGMEEARRGLVWPGSPVEIFDSEHGSGLRATRSFSVSLSL